jgi:hypothetical protein
MIQRQPPRENRIYAKPEPRNIPGVANPQFELDRTEIKQNLRPTAIAFTVFPAEAGPYGPSGSPTAALMLLFNAGGQKIT